MDSLNYNSVETLPGFNARAAFQVNSASVFREDVDIPFEPLAIFENPENKKTARCYVAHCFCGVSEICSSIDNVEVVKFMYLFMYRFCIFHIPFFCVPKNPCCGFDSFFLSLFPNDC